MAWNQKDRTYNINLKINMGFFDAIGATANRAKLNGEIALVDREITTRKKQFGVELYDIISKQQKQRMKNDGTISGMLETPGMFHTIENEIKEPLDKYSKEIRVMELEKRNIENEIELHEAKKIRDSGAASSAGVGKRMSDTAKETELFVKIKYLDREMLLRKEQFGLSVWDAATGQDWFHEALVNETKDKSGMGVITGTVGGLVKGVKGTLGKTLGACSAEEREIAACVKQAKEDVKPLEEKKRGKEKELAAIVGKS